MELSPNVAMNIFRALEHDPIAQRDFMGAILGGGDTPRQRTRTTAKSRSPRPAAKTSGTRHVPTSNNRPLEVESAPITTNTKGSRMATATKSSAAKKAAAAKAKAKTSAAKPAAKKAAAKTAAASTNGDGPGKREAQKARDAELTAQILEMRGNDAKWGEIASELSITSGKAQFLIMLHEVAEGTVPKITWRNDTEKVAKVKKAREAQDEHSSWGWLAARTGISEGTLKAFMSEHMDVKGTNVAIARGAATKTNGTTKIGGAPAKKAAAKGTSSAAAKAKAAKAKRAGRPS
jgi:hypothetical protein